MNFLWLAMIILSASWAWILPLYEKPNLLGWLLCLGLAFGLMWISIRGEERKRVNSSPQDSFAAVRQAVQYSILLLLAQAAVLPFYYIWASRHHAESVLPPILSKLLNVLGVKAVAEGALLYMQAPLRNYSFLSTWEKFGAFYLLLFVVGLTVTLLLSKAGRKEYFLLTAITGMYFILRYCFVILLYNSYFLHGLFWERSFTFVTLLPLALLYSACTTPKMAEIDVKPHFPRNRQDGVSAVLMFFLVSFCVLFLGFSGAGVKKQGRVVIDEYHSDWEWTTEIYDEHWFGERSGYNYYCFYNYIRHFYDTKINHKPIEAGTLKECDILILKTPTKGYEEEEIEAIVEFVTSGGGLYLIGDHTNVFGTGTNLNQLAQHFDITFRYDCTYDLASGNLSEYDKPCFLPHAVVQELPHFLFATSNTLQAPWYAQDMIRGYGLKNLQADYSQKNFFPEDANHPHLEFGLFLQSAGIEHGKGRVLAFTDSTVFSNFWMFMNGKPELLLASLNWLNHTNALPVVNGKRWLAGLILLLVLANIYWWVTKKEKLSLFVLVSAAVSTAIVAVLGLQMLNKSLYPLPEPIEPMVKIGFDRQYSRIQLPDSIPGFLAESEEQLNTFYVWTQRLNYFPKAYDRLERAMADADVIVISKPEKAIQNPEEILKKVGAGKGLLIMDNAEAGLHANDLLQRIGMQIEAQEMAKFADYEEIKQIPLSENAAVVIGGESLIRDADGNTILAVKLLKAGFVAVFSDPDIFYNHHLGDVSMNLTEKTDTLSRFEFKVLKKLLAEKCAEHGL